MRRSASNPSSIFFSLGTKLPSVFFCNIPRMSIQCLPSSRSTSRWCVTGCSIIPNAEAALDAIDIMNDMKLAGSRAAPRSSSVNSSSSSGAASAVSGGIAISGVADSGVGAGAGVGAASGAATTSGSGFSSGGKSRGLPSALKRRRSVTLKLGWSSFMALLNHKDTRARKHEKGTFLLPALWFFGRHFRLRACPLHLTI